jgi:antitoxin HicB
MIGTPKHRLYKVTITKDAEMGYFIAEVPTLSPCITYGETLDEAMTMAQEAIEGLIESRLANGYPVPDDTDELEQIATSVQAILPVSASPSYRIAA